MSKLTSLFAVLLLLLFSTLSSAARREPAAFVSDAAVKPLYEEVEADNNTEVVEESCEGASDKDDCLMRRTLTAHIDYIYTQKNPKP